MGKNKRSRVQQQNSFSTGSQKVDCILRTLFTRVMSLEQWIHCTDRDGILTSSLVTSSDPPSYISLLQTTVVGLRDDSRKLEGPVSLSQVSHQREVILRAIQRVIQRDGHGRNVLTSGFAVMSDNPKASVSSVPSIEYRYPNSCVNRLQFAVWKTLLSRIGDLVMGHLLEDTSVFMHVAKPAVYVQLTGEAVYQAWPYSAGSTLSAEILKPQQQTEKNRNKNVSSKRPREDSETSTEKHQPSKKLKSDRNSEVLQGKLLGSGETSGKQSKDVSQEQMRGGCSESVAQLQHRRTFFATKQSDQPNHPCSPTVQPTQLSGEQCRANPPMLTPPSAQLRSGQGEHKRAKWANHKEDVTRTRTHSVPKRKTTNDTVEQSTTAENKKSECDMPKKKPKKRKRLKTHKNPKCSEKIKSYQYHKYVPRLSLLYGKNLRERFPESFTLANLEPSEEGARQLMVDIFLKTDVGDNLLDSLPCQCQIRPEREIRQGRETPCGRNSSVLPVTGGDTAGLQQQSSELLSDDAETKVSHRSGNSQADNLHQCLETPCESSSSSGASCGQMLQACVTVTEENGIIDISCSSTEPFTDLSGGHSEAKCDAVISVSSCNSSEEYVHIVSSGTSAASVTACSPVPEQDVLTQDRQSSFSTSPDVIPPSPVSVTSSGRVIQCLQPPLSQCGKEQNSNRVQGRASGSVIVVAESENSHAECLEPNLSQYCPCSPDVSLQPATSSVPLVQKYSSGGFSHNTPVCVRVESEKPSATSEQRILCLSNLSYDSHPGMETSFLSQAMRSGQSQSSLSAHLSDTCRSEHRISPHECHGSSTVHHSLSSSCADRDMSEYSSKSDSSAQCIYSDSKKDTDGITPHSHPSFYDPDNSGDKALACVNITAFCELSSGQKGVDSTQVQAPTLSQRPSAQSSDRTTENPKPSDLSVRPSTSTVQGAKDLQASQDRTLVTGTPGDKQSKLSLFSPEAKQYVLPLLQQLIRNHRKCPYWSLLRHHCKSKYSTANDTARRQKRNTKPAFKMCHLLEDSVPVQNVFAFVRAIVLRTVPVQLFGSSTKKALFLKNVFSLLSSGKFEKMCLGQLMKNVKPKHCDWLRGAHCQKEREHHIAQLMWWLLVYYVFHVIKTFFYATDTTVFRNRVLYYRKGTWLRLQARGIQDFRKSVKLKYISETEVNRLLESRQSLGVSTLRFLPKTQSLRPIVNMSSKSKPDSPQEKSINRQLLNLLQALTFEKTVDSSIYGCSAFGMDDIYTAFRQFVLQRAAHADTRPLYFVKTDISKCFDSIQQEKLYSIVEDILNKDGGQTYVTRKYAGIVLTGQRLKRAFHLDTRRLTHFQPDFFTFIRQKAAGGRLKNVILVDQVLCQQDDSKSLLQLLSSHLFKNIVKIGTRYYLQQTGVSQGSVVSSLLASIYLAHLEKTHLSVAQDELLVRMMDDYLFITPDDTRAGGFLTTMVEGFPDYNCFCHPDKILTNFQCEHPAHGLFQSTQPGEPFPWCGLLIDTSTLEVAVDYSRYSGLSVANTVSFDASHKPGQTLRNKLLMCLKIKCHLIFFDPQINSQEKLLVNAYQVFLYLSLVFHTFVMKLPAAQRVSSNLPFFHSTVQMMPQFLHSQVTKKLKQIQSGTSFPVPVQVLQWLCSDAFLLKLNRFSEYVKLRKLLRQNRVSLEKKMGAEQVKILREVHKAGVTLDSTIILL